MDTVDRNEKIWTFSDTGNLLHAFVQSAGPGRLRALCRSTIVRAEYARFVGRDNVRGMLCSRCEKLAEAMWDRAEASMESVTEAHDLGYVAPVDERDETDNAHAEALELDAAGEALTQAHAEAMTLLPKADVVRWHYRARRTTSQGAFLGIVEGYLSLPADVDQSAMEERLRELDSTFPPGTRLSNFTFRRA